MSLGQVVWETLQASEQTLTTFILKLFNWENQLGASVIWDLLVCKYRQTGAFARIDILLLSKIWLGLITSNF